MNVFKEIEGGFDSVYLGGWSDGALRASVEDVRLGPVLVARDGVGMAHMGCPLASYLCPGVDTERLDRFRGPVSLPMEISFLVSPGLAWGGGKPPVCGGASALAPVVW